MVGCQYRGQPGGTLTQDTVATVEHPVPFVATGTIDLLFVAFVRSAVPYLHPIIISLTVLHATVCRLTASHKQGV